MNYPKLLQMGVLSYPVEYQTALKSTSSVRIKNGVVQLKLSRFVQGRRRDEIVEKFLKWAGKRLNKVRQSTVIKPVYRNGGRIVTHNKIYELVVSVVHGDSSRAKVRDESILDIKISATFAKLNNFEIEDRVRFFAEKLIMKDQLPYLGEVLAELNQLYFQEKINGWRFKRVNSRFGSCSTRRNINIAFRLLFAPREVFRYVCVHELAHLREMNHSARFWDLVERAMPDYLNAEKWLNGNGFLLG